MSNCIDIPQSWLALDPEHFDYSLLKPAKDLDKNELSQDKDGVWIFKPGYTTWRGLRCFIGEHLCHAAKVDDLYADIEDCYDDGDRDNAITLRLYFDRNYKALTMADKWTDEALEAAHKRWEKLAQGYYQK